MSQLLIKHRQSRPIAITSLVDVVFILLLFFMLTSSFNDWNAIHLKQAVSGSSALNKNSQSQLIVVHASGGVSLIGESKHSSAHIETMIKQLDQLQPLVLFPESKVTVQVIVSLLHRLEKSGFQYVSLGKTLADKTKS